jgi:putative acetyltransferase
MVALQRTTASDPRLGPLIAELDADLRGRGFSSAILETGTGQAEAIALYERCGYGHIPQFPPYVGMPVSVCMRKAL